MDYGYIPDYEQIDAFSSTLCQSRQDLISLVSSDNNQDAFLYRPLVFCLSKSPVASKWLVKDGEYVRLKAYNQGNIGSCVGNAEALCLSTEAALDIVQRNEPETFQYMASPEACYGFGREAGGMLGGGDGCYGAAVAKADMSFGTLWQTSYGSIDLADYSVGRCRDWGRNGVPSGLRDIAKQHKLSDSYRIKTVEEAWALIGAGHPINQCSNLGFSTTRDAEGISRQSGSWGHSMAIIGRRTTKGGNRLFLIQNSWGDNWASGGLYEDQPQGSFYCSDKDVEKAIGQGDVFVKINVDGIQRKNLDWGDW